MSRTPFTTGQLGKLQSLVNIGVATVLSKVAEQFSDPKRVLKAFEGRGEMFARHMEPALEQAIRSMLVLVPHKPIELTISARRDPNDYYQTRAGLWVHDVFRNLVVANAKPVDAGTVFKVSESEIVEHLMDAHIKAALPKNHLFDKSAACAIVAEMIEAGRFDKKLGYVLYTASCIVDVGWDVDSQRWSIFTWDRGGGFYRGYRILYPSN